MTAIKDYWLKILQVESVGYLYCKHLQLISRFDLNISID
jgi:hypothetical protein